MEKEVETEGMDELHCIIHLGIAENPLELTCCNTLICNACVQQIKQY